MTNCLPSACSALSASPCFSSTCSARTHLWLASCSCVAICWCWFSELFEQPDASCVHDTLTARSVDCTCEPVQRGYLPPSIASANGTLLNSAIRQLPE